jgi:predicted nucleotidyltransferase component of viral defense system
MFFMERFLARLSVSPRRDNFVLKGGLLISSMIGLQNRITKDLDVSALNLSFNRAEIENIINLIISEKTDDGVSFSIYKTLPIREQFKEPDFRVVLNTKFNAQKANFHKANFHIDIVSGDANDPPAVPYEYKTLFNDKTLTLMAASVETVLAEKILTILYFNVEGTRFKDYYDVYTLFAANADKLNYETMFDIIKRKSALLDYQKYADNAPYYLDLINKSHEINAAWKNYKTNNPYMKDIDLRDIIAIIEKIFHERAQS